MTELAFRSDRQSLLRPMQFHLKQYLRAPLAQSDLDHKGSNLLEDSHTTPSPTLNQNYTAFKKAVT